MSGIMTINQLDFNVNEYSWGNTAYRDSGRTSCRIRTVRISERLVPGQQLVKFSTKTMGSSQRRGRCLETTLKGTSLTLGIFLRFRCN